MIIAEPLGLALYENSIDGKIRIWQPSPFMATFAFWGIRSIALQTLPYVHMLTTRLTTHTSSTLRQFPFPLSTCTSSTAFIVGLKAEASSHANRKP